MSAQLTIREEFEIITQNNLPEETQDMVFCRDYGAPIKANGLTGFLRHIGISMLAFQAFSAKAKVDDGQTVRILAAPSSIGAEAYGLSAIAAKSGLGGDAGFSIDAFDRSENFMKIARRGIYPQELANTVAAPWRDIIFDPNEGTLRHVRDSIKERVHFLEPQAFEDFEPCKHYDIVFANYLFQYLNDEQREDTLVAIQDTLATMIVFDRKKPFAWPEDMPYVPITEHAGWADTAIAKSKTVLGYYNVMVHKDLGPRTSGL